MTPPDRGSGEGDRVRRIGAVAPDAPVEFELVLRYPPGEQQKIAEEAAQLLSGAIRSRAGTEAARRSADPEDVRAVRAFTDRAGLTTTAVDADSRRVSLRGPAGRVGPLFGITFVDVETPSGRYRDYEGSLVIPPDISPIVEAVLNLSTRRVAKHSTRVSELGRT